MCIFGFNDECLRVQMQRHIGYLLDASLRDEHMVAKGRFMSAAS